MLGPTLHLRRPLALATAAAAGVVGVLAVLPGAAAGATTAVPYTDPNAHGVIGFCDRAGHQITHGSINTTPFAWRAVSSVAATAPYAVAGRTATLYAYQPRRGLDAGDWSGTQLTASARYTDVAHPMAAATSADLSLEQFTAQFAPQWDGLLQLRIFLGAPDQETDSLTYPATTIKVTGQTWQVLNPVAAPCDTGTSESIESIVLPHPKGSATATSPSGQGRSEATVTSPAAIGGSPSPVGPPSPAVTPTTSSVALASSSSAGGSGHGVDIGVGAAVVAALVAGGFFVGRRSTSRSAG